METETTKSEFPNGGEVTAELRLEERKKSYESHNLRSDYEISLHKKGSFPLRISSVNVTSKID